MIVINFHTTVENGMLLPLVTTEITFRSSLMIIPLRSWFACRPCRSGNDTAGTCQASLGGHASSFGWPQSAGQKETNDGGDGGQRVGFQRGRNSEVRGVAPQLFSFVTSYLKYWRCSVWHKCKAPFWAICCHRWISTNHKLNVCNGVDCVFFNTNTSEARDANVKILHIPVSE